MKVTEKKAKNGEIHLTAIASTQEVSQAFHRAHLAFANQMGIRPDGDKDVVQLVREQLGITDLDTIVSTQAVQNLVPFAIDKRNLMPAFPPTPILNSQIKRGKTFTFELHVTPKPTFELESYDPVTITVRPLTVDEKDVDEELERLAKNNVRFEHDEPHPIGEGDSFKLGIVATQNGKQLKGLTTPGRTYQMGLNLMPEEFERQLVGMNVGEVKNIRFTLPGDTEGPIDARVTVLEMRKCIIPTIDDEWVAQNRPNYVNLQIFRDATRKQIENALRPKYEEMKLSLAATELSKRFKGHIDDSIYEASQKTYLENMRASLEQQGQDFDEFVKSQGGEQQFGMMTMLQVRSNLVQGYSLDAVFRHEKMTLTEEDLNRAARELNPQNPMAVRQEIDETGQGYVLREVAQRIKANQWVLNNAEVIVRE